VSVRVPVCQSIGWKPALGRLRTLAPSDGLAKNLPFALNTPSSRPSRVPGSGRLPPVAIDVLAAARVSLPVPTYMVSSGLRTQSILQFNIRQASAELSYRKAHRTSSALSRRERGMDSPKVSAVFALSTNS